MSESVEGLDDWVDRWSEWVGMPLDPEYRPGVVKTLTQLEAIAQRVLEFPLPDDLDIAPTFEP